MSYNGSGTFNINSTGQPVVAGTVITASAFNALTTDLATGLTTAITKDGQTTTTARITFAQGITSSLTTDSSSVSTGSIITAGGAGIAKNLYVGGIASFSAQPIFTSLTASSAVATDASKGLVSVTNTGTGNNVLATSPTLVTPILGTPQSGTLTSCTGLPNAGLVNSSVTIGGTAIALGASSSTITNDLSISGLTVGKGGAGGAANTAFGNTAIPIAPNSGVTAIGNHAGAVFNTSSDTGQSTFVGYYAGAQVSTGTDNTFVGGSVGTNTTTGAKNTAIGSQALTANTTASNNTAVGYQAGYAITTGAGNTFIGNTSGSAVTTGGANTIIGAFSGNYLGLDIRTASNYIVLSDGAGNPRGYFRGSDGIFSCLGSYTVTTSNAANVNIDASGFMLRSTSALKYKQDVRDLESINITKFRPVRYKSKCENDDQTLDHFGVIADEVDKAGIKELVSYGAKGEVEGFQYERLTVVLLKSLQELKTIVDAQAAEIAELKAKVGI